jgi:death-on-curing protein
VTPQELSNLITPERVMALHREGSARYGGDPTQREGDVECVDGRIGGAVNAAAYSPEGDDDSGLIFAAFLLYYLAKGHCFVDGNKRVAWLAAIECFKNIQVTMAADEDEAYELVINVSSEGSKVTPAEIAIWMAERLEDAAGELVN